MKQTTSIIKILLSYILPVCIMCSCSEEPEISTGTIIGTVNSSDNGTEALSGVSVTIKETGTSSSTGTDGSFKFSNLKPGAYTLSFVKSGYTSDSRNVSVVAGKESRVDIQLEKVVEKAEISVSPRSIDFGTTHSELSVTISNGGKASAEWSVDLGDNHWLSVSQTSGTILPGKSQSVTFKADRGKVAEQKSVVVNLHADGNIIPLTVTCSPEKKASEMSVAPAELDFGTDASTLDVTIRNTGNADLDWTAVKPLPEEISLSAESGKVASGGDMIVKVTLDRAKIKTAFSSTFSLSDGTRTYAVGVKAQAKGDVPGGGDIAVSSGLYAYFPFDGNLKNLTENEITGYGNPEPSYVDGLVSGLKAASFSRTDKSSFVVSQGLVDGKEMTVSFWAKDISEGNIYHVVSSNTANSKDGVMMVLRFEEGHLKYIIDRYKINYEYAKSGNLTHSKINDGAWHHIALVSDYEKTKYTCATIRLYVDGELMDTLTEEINHFSELEVEKKHFGTGTRFVMGGDNVPNMKIANFRVYDARCLAASEIKEIFQKKQ